MQKQRPAHKVGASSHFSALDCMGTGYTRDDVLIEWELSSRCQPSRSFGRSIVPLPGYTTRSSVTAQVQTNKLNDRYCKACQSLEILRAPIAAL